MEKQIILHQALNQLNSLKEKNISSNQNFWQLFLQHQNMIEPETMECLFMLNFPYEEMFYSARNGNYKEASQLLKKAHSLKNRFEFDEDTNAIFRIITYPNIAYLQYKMKKFYAAKYYTKRTINLIKEKGYQDPIFLFRIIQQEINYITLYFDTNEIEKGINLSLKTIIDCHHMINECKEKKTYYKDYLEDTLVLYHSNMNLLTKKLITQIEQNNDKLLECNAIKWKLMKDVINLSFT